MLKRIVTRNIPVNPDDYVGRPGDLLIDTETGRIIISDGGPGLDEQAVAPAPHTHEISDVAGLTDALNNPAPHTHSVFDIAGLAAVAITGNYADLVGAPGGAGGQLPGFVLPQDDGKVLTVDENEGLAWKTPSSSQNLNGELWQTVDLDSLPPVFDEGGVKKWVLPENLFWFYPRPHPVTFYLFLRYTDSVYHSSYQVLIPRLDFNAKVVIQPVRTFAGNTQVSIYTGSSWTLAEEIGILDDRMKILFANNDGIFPSSWMARKGDGPFRIVLKLPYNFFRVRFYPSGQMPVSPPLGIAAVGEEGGTVSFGDFLSISDESTIFSWSNHFTTGSTVSYGITYKFFRLPVLLPAFNPSLTVSFDAEFFSYDNPSLPFRPHMFIQVGFIYNNYGFLTNMREWPLYDEMNLYNLPFVLRFSSKKDLLGYKYFYEQYSYSDRITVTALCGSFSAVPEIQWAEVRLDNFRIIAEID